MLLTFFLPIHASAGDEHDITDIPTQPDADKPYLVEGSKASLSLSPIDKWRGEINNEYSKFSLNDQSIGNINVKNHPESTVFLADAYALFTKNELKKIASTPNIPETTDAVNVAYNLPEMQEYELRLMAHTVEGIFTGEIITRSYQVISDTNPDLNLTDEDITYAVDYKKQAEDSVLINHGITAHGQQYTPELESVPLLDEIVEIAKNSLWKIRYDWSPVWDHNPVAYAESDKKIRIDAAGASFAFPLMDLWRVKYSESHPNISLNYQPIGSGGGVKQHIEKTINFAASDAPLKNSEYERAPGTITIPKMIGAVSITYNVPGIPNGLKLTEKAICDMYLGKITKWNDPKIADSNPELDLPDEGIMIAQRSDGSGTTFAFTSYLTKTCPEWDDRVGAGKSVQWPVGRGAPGNEGVAGIIKYTEGAIGYITLAYAFQEEMHTAAVQNGDKTGFVMPTLKSASEASEGAAPTLPKAHESWRGVDLLAAPGENSYPITTFSYLILHPDLDGSVKDYDHAKAVADLIAWILTDGQKYNTDLLYVPISVPMTNIGLEGLSKITYQGQPIYDGPTSIKESTDDVETIDETDQAMTHQSKTAAIPNWIKDIFEFYSQGNLSDDELIAVLQYLVKEGIIKLE